MGLLLSIPILIVFKAIKKYYSSGVQDNENSGAMLQVKQHIFSLLLKISKLWQTKRIQNYSPEPNGEIDKIGLVPLQSDHELDNPGSKISQQSNIDDVCFSGVNSKGEFLLVRLARRAEDRVEIALYLKLSDGSKYQLPLLPDTRAYTSDAHGFSSNGLKLQCLSAMTRWRISYNGFLRRVQGRNEENDEVVHVKFSFTWGSASLVYDFQTEFHCDLLAECLSKDSFLFPYSTLDKLKERLDCYEQWGQFFGTVSIGTQDEKEIYLWGARTRNRGIMEWKEIGEYLSICGQMKDGLKFHLGTVSMPGVVSKLKYGYIILPSHFVHPIESCYYETVCEGESIPEKITFNAGGKMYNLYYTQSNDGFDAYYGDDWNVSSKLRYTKFIIDEFEGRGFVEKGIRNETEKPPPIPQIRPRFLREPETEGVRIPWVIEFTEELCQASKIAGGKGSSLAMLTKLLSTTPQNNKQTNLDGFAVPKGVVVTTAAYRRYLHENQALALEISSLASNLNLKEMEQVSKKLMNFFTRTFLSDKLKAAILEKIQCVFPQGLSNRTFAVRSSASGEDSEDTSAAGQMDTFLGIKTIDQIYESVVKCWSSQFSLTAINYKRQTGQIIDSDMAVVIQEMVPAEIAGVAFTLDPLTSNPENITITANYGLGESVVSATAEPDTIILKRSVNNEVVFHTESIGRKDITVEINNEGGVSSKPVGEEDAKKCCLKREDSLKIGRAAVLVEQSFGNPRDIEWAIAEEKLYLLQARPITTCDLETDFEIVHELDTALITDFEYLTKANVGEVMPTSMCPLTISSVSMMMDIAFQYGYLKRFGANRCVYHPGFPTILAYCGGHTFINVIETILKQVSENENATTEGWQWSLFGRTIENGKELREVALHRYGVYPTLRGIKDLFDTFIESFSIRKDLDAAREEVIRSYFPDDMKFISSHQLYTIISRMLPKHCKPSLAHSDCSGLSSLYNIFILGMMANKTGDMNESLFAIFSKLMSNCENVESADVPQSMKNLADTIILYGAKEKISKMTPEEAAKWLQEDEGQVGAKYREFLRQHGHRCLMEFDLYRLPWSMDAASFVRSLQSMMKQPNTRVTNKSKDTSDSAVNQLSLNIGSKLILKTLVKWARRAVGFREQSKSVLIRSVNVFRRAYRKLGQVMRDEGRIPEEDIIFFLTHEEIGELLKTRSARLLSKAIRRKRMHPKLNALRFPEFISGPPQPIKAPSVAIENGVSDWIIKATPVSQGKACAPARVVMSLDEADTIQPGDVLVTYSTDIGWTPYFPLLSGVVTELGGLISHGAVVAREFGLPCIVGAINATYIVKSGDLVILDGKNGTLRKVSKAEGNSP